MKRLLTALRGDLRNIMRDRMLAILPFVPYLAAFGLRVIFPVFARFMARWVDLWPYHPYLGVFFLLIGAVMNGMIAGFLFLDEYEADILSSVAVSPIGLKRFAAYRLGAATVLAFLTSLTAWPILGVATPPLPAFLSAVALSALCAPAIALMLLAFASNKIEGLTIGKLTSIVIIAPIADLVVPAPWNRLAGFLPTWWPNAVFFGGSITKPVTDALPLGIAVAGGLVVATLWIAGFGALANRKLEK